MSAKLYVRLEELLAFRSLLLERRISASHLVPAGNFCQPSRTSTRWWYEVASGGGRQYRPDGGSFPAGTRWLAEVSGWYEMAG